MNPVFMHKKCVPNSNPLVEQTGSESTSPAFVSFILL